MYGSTDNRKKLKESRKKLDSLYAKIPDTKGCLENNTKEGGCKSWCCFLQTPQVLYVEFLNAWNAVTSTWKDQNIQSLVEKCLKKYLFPNQDKSCVFIDVKTNKCSHHETRCLNCFLPGTWILTKNGPKCIENIYAGDLVYGHDGRLHLVTHSFSKIYDGIICKIKPQGNTVYSSCTTEHKWLVNEQKDKRKIPNLFWKNAINLIPKKGKKTGNYLSYPRIFHNNNKDLESIDCTKIISALPKDNRLYSFVSNKQNSSLPIEIKVDSEFLFMMGLYIAEGSSSNFGVQFSMNINEKPILERIQKYLFTLDINSHFNNIQSNNTIVLSVNNCCFGKFMKNLCGHLAHNKAINENIFGVLSHKQLFSIFEAWHVGDGRKPSHRNCIAYSGTTVSEKLIMQMQQICLMNGLYPRIRKDHIAKDGRYSFGIIINQSSFDNWRAKKGQGSKTMYNEKFVMVPLSESVEENYSGPVFDISISEAESFVTSSGIAHNCRIYGITPEEEFKPRYERLKIIYPETRNQCNLVSTVDGKAVTTKDTNNWWLELNAIEMGIGIKKDKITDQPGGSYRTYHDHILIHLLGEQGMIQLSELRQKGNNSEKEKAIFNIMEAMKKFKESADGKEKKDATTPQG